MSLSVDLLSKLKLLFISLEPSVLCQWFGMAKLSSISLVILMLSCWLCWHSRYALLDCRITLSLPTIHSMRFSSHFHSISRGLAICWSFVTISQRSFSAVAWESLSDFTSYLDVQLDSVSVHQETCQSRISQTFSFSMRLLPLALQRFSSSCITVWHSREANAITTICHTVTISSMEKVKDDECFTMSEARRDTSDTDNVQMKKQSIYFVW